MKPLARLANLLRPPAQQEKWQLPPCRAMDQLLQEMENRLRNRVIKPPGADMRLDAVRRFWESAEVKSFRDAYLLSWSLEQRPWPNSACIMEDRSRLQGLLDGVDQWRAEPRQYRRCYLGLSKGYFTYDGPSQAADSAALRNWRLLRDYLQRNNPRIQCATHNPAWVEYAQQHRHVFSDTPCAPYVETLLRGDTSIIEALCQQLHINQASWFLRELVLAQVEGATRLSNAQFLPLLPRLLDLLRKNEVLRDRGMIALLDRYAEIEQSPLHQDLRDCAIAWWGNPWLPSNKTRWGGVQAAAREMVASWLKLEFIETFFTKLAEDGLSDARRMNFWKRYVNAIDHIEFALGSSARNAKDADMVLLRKKMHGIVAHLDHSTNNAFIMHMGRLVAVEFSATGNAFYAYDAGRELPFNTKQILSLPVNAENSLKDKGKCIIKESHTDGRLSHDKWETRFEARLRQEFDLTPSRALSTTQLSAGGLRRQAAPLYSRAALIQFVQQHHLEIRDMTASGGNLWVVADDSQASISHVLKSWGFQYRSGKGWWRQA
ncbi:EH signature domain-containing protein [Massilia sp. W12]|uniref:EH signature domain-containing protein n=1 Tax=Massilia sp. W12 TaxID=3126507 RepID=UPI0030CA9813